MPDQIGDRDEQQPVPVGERAEVGDAGHAAVVEDNFAQHPCREASGEAGEIDGSFGVPGTFQYPAGAGAEGEDVAGPVERLGADVHVGERT